MSRYRIEIREDCPHRGIEYLGYMLNGRERHLWFPNFCEGESVRTLEVDSFSELETALSGTEGSLMGATLPRKKPGTVALEDITGTEEE